MTQLSVYAMDVECETMEFKWFSETTSGKTATLLQELRKLHENVHSDIADQDNAHSGFMQDIYGYYENYNSAITNASELAQKFDVSMRDVMVLLEDPSYAELKLAKQFLAAVKANEEEQKTAFAKLGPSQTYSPSKLFGQTLMTFLNSL